MAQGLFARTGVRYEVACDAIGALLAHYAALIATERDKDAPDAGVIADAEAEQRRLRDAREALDPADASAVEEVIATYGQQALALYQ